MMEITILGCGAALPAHGRHCSGQVITVDGHRYMIDCGEGTQTQLRIAHQKLQSMTRIFISHLHGDHVFGLPGLLSTMHLCGRKDPIDIYSPKGLQEILTPFFSVCGSHIDFEVRYHVISGNQILLEDNKVRVTAFPLHHSIETYGFSFEELSPRHPRRYVYCSDTGYSEDLIPHLLHADLACLESTFTHKYAPLALEKGHLTARQAAQLAQAAEVKQLMLTHFSARYKELDPVLEEARAVFPNTIPATEGETLRLK